MSELVLPTGPADPPPTSNGQANATNPQGTAAATPVDPSLTQSSSAGPTPSASQQTDSNSNSLPSDFISQLSSGPIYEFLSQNTSKSDLTPRQVRESLATLDSVKQLEIKHNLKIDYGDKVQKKQLSSAIKQVWETLGELDSEDEPVSKADLKKDAALAWKLNREMMARMRPTRNGGSSSSTNSGGKGKSKTKSQGSASSSSQTKSSKGKRAASDEIDSDEDPEAGPSTSSSSKKPQKKKKKKDDEGGEKVKKPPNPNNPFNKPYVLDAKMADVCGAEELPRHGVTKQLWVYIKANDLQDPSNKRKILCDAKLESLFGKKVVDSFEMSKLIGSHLRKKDELI